MILLSLKKVVFVKSKKYEELWFFTAFAIDTHSKEIKIQGLATPELAQVFFLIWSILGQNFVLQNFRVKA